MNSELYNGPPEISQYTSKAVEICTLAEKMLEVYFLLYHSECNIMSFLPLTNVCYTHSLFNRKLQERKEQLMELEMNIQSTLNERVDLESNATSTMCAEEVEEASPGSRPDELESRLNENIVKIELGLYLVNLF